MEEEKRESQKNVSDKFLDAIFNSLGKLDDHERDMLEGCANLLEYIPHLRFRNPSESLNYVQAKNMQLMVDEFNFLFGYIQGIVEEPKLKEMEEKLKNIRTVIINGIKNKKTKEVIYPFYENYSQQNNSRRMALTNLFPLVCGSLSDLKREVISSLSYILYSRKENMEELKKIY